MASATDVSDTPTFCYHDTKTPKLALPATAAVHYNELLTGLAMPISETIVHPWILPFCLIHTVLHFAIDET